MTETNLRPNVGSIILHPGRDDGRVWLGRRSTRLLKPETWQFPQGGRDPGEDVLTAAKREVQEETGMTSLMLLHVFPEAYEYRFPPGVVKHGYNGQRQSWVVFRLLGDESEIDLTIDNEFDAWRWANITEAPNLVTPFKRGVYERVVADYATWRAQSRA